MEILKKTSKGDDPREYDSRNLRKCFMMMKCLSAFWIDEICLKYY